MAIIKPLQSVTLKNDNGDDIKYDVLTRSEVSGILAAIGATTESTTSGNPLTLTSVESLKAVKEKGETSQDSTTGKNKFSVDALTGKTIYRANIQKMGDNVNSFYLGGAQGANDNMQLIVNSWAYCALYTGIKVTADTPVVISCKIKNYTADCNGFVRLRYNTTETRVGATTLMETNFNATGTTDISASGTVPSGNYVILEFSPASKSTSMTLTQYAEVTECQLEIGTSTATSFEPYTGGAPAPSPSYPQGIYGLEGYSDAECTTLETDPYADRYYKVDVTVDGVTKTVRTAEKIAPLYDGDYLDFVSGTVHREKAKTTIPANDTWSWHNTSVFAYHDITGAIITDMSTQGTKEVDCDIAKGVAWTQRAQSYWTASLRYGQSSVALKSPSVTTYAQFQAATANLPITFVYQLDTPTDTPTDLTADLSDVYGTLTLNGNGTMEVTYRHG